MMFTNISLTNFDLLRTYIEEIKGSQVEESVTSILERVSIAAEIEKISIMEVIAFKRLGVLEKYNQMRMSSSDTIYNLANATGLNEGDRNFLKEIYTGLNFVYLPESTPLGYEMYTATVKFRGKQLLNFFGYNVEDFFKDDGKSKMGHVKTIKLRMEEMVKENIVRAVRTVDKNTVQWLATHVYEALSSDENSRYDMKLIQIVNDAGDELSFVNSDPAKVKHAMEFMQKYARTADDPSYDIYIACRTPVKRYFELLMNDFRIIDHAPYLTWFMPSQYRAKRPMIPTIDKDNLEYTVLPYEDWFTNKVQSNDNFSQFLKILLCPGRDVIEFTLRLNDFELFSTSFEEDVNLLFDRNCAEVLKSIKTIFTTYGLVR